ncbi:MAG: pyruvate, water dikinase, partial [Planctomycetia bacterium]|nr:pyruvate, water dikinase [Planctomycetia bacterium]
MTAVATDFIKRFAQIGIEDIASVGGKNASLGEMVRELVPRGIRVPDGFAVTAEAYRYFLTANRLDDEIRRELGALDVGDVAALQRCGSRVRQLILDATFPDDLRQAIVEAYGFAGQQETYLNVQGPTQLLETCRRCFASLFTDRAISYRIDKGFDHLKIALSIGVQRMVRSDLASSGVMFSLDTESGFADAVLINAAYGLGENVVQGAVNPDEYYVFKPTLKQGLRPIIRRTLGTKEFKLIYDVGGSKMVRNVPVAETDRRRFALNDDEVLELARYAIEIEKHYSAKRGLPTPMDMEWAKDGRTGELFIVQARPETVVSQRSSGIMETYRLEKRGEVLISGRSIGEKIAAGPIRKIENLRQLSTFQDGDVLVADKTDPDWEPIMKRAAAIVTNRGGRTCHAAIVSRELGVPAIVGTEHGTERLTEGAEITISCAEGDTGYVYTGRLPFTVETTDLSTMAHPHTKIMVNVANPDEAFGLSFLPCDGVGLAREIARLTEGYADKPQYFVDRLAEGVATLAAAFYPRDVIVRMSDFKTNEYAHLIGGAPYEPIEENPMIGFRGASRYYDPRYRDGFALECRAMLKVREEMGLTNLKLMIPFCRTVEEGRRVQQEMAKHGLVRGRNGLELYVMCEIP